MKYFKQSKVDGSVTEITKEKARQLLEGGWKEDFLADLLTTINLLNCLLLFQLLVQKKKNNML